MRQCTARNDLALAKEARLQAEQFSALVIEQVKQEEQILLQYYSHYEQTFKQLTSVVNLAIADSTQTEKAIHALAEGLNVKFEYETLDEFTAFMLSDETLKL